MRTISFFISIIFITMLLFSQLPEDHLESKVLTSVYSNEYDGYYVNLTDVSIVDLHSELNELISTSHTKIYYVDNWDHIAEFHKSPYDEGNITLFYTQRSHDSNDSRWYDGGTLIGNDDSWNREHIWPKSHGDL